MRRLLLLALAALVGGCGSSAQLEAGARAERKKQRQEAALAHERQGPAVKAHAVGGNQLIVVDVPVADRDGLSLDQQKCFVWRDAEFRTASLSCPARETYVGSP